MNETQRRHLQEGLAHLERQLGAIEAILEGAGKGRMFSRWSDDLDPEERARQSAAVARVRAAMREVMRSEGIEEESATLGARQALQSQWALAEIGLEELGPRGMRGFGELEESDKRKLEAVVAQMHAALPQGRGEAQPHDALADALAAATEAAMHAMAAALVEASQTRRRKNELPLIAGDALQREAERVCREQGVEGALPAMDIDTIPWRLDPSIIPGLARPFLMGRYRGQLRPLEGSIRDALRAYGARVSIGLRGTPRD